MERAIIQVENVSKSFKVYYDKGYTLKERLLFSNRRRAQHRSVLNNVSFEVKRGEAVGIIGENGCGKSTMLKMLSKIMFPDQGTITMDGRVSALIELGAGFHPDMSGRENIYINAAIFGLTRKEIEDRMQTIIDFSELGKYIDNPVRTYSSGMYMRLAFSVAINVDADILLVDEILAVGDAAFQAKCFNKMQEIKANGTTIVIVSHSLEQVEQICDRSIWICDGAIRMMGVPRDIHPSYLNFMWRKNNNDPQPQTQKKENYIEEKTGNVEESENRWGNGDAIITQVCLLDKDGKDKTTFATGEAMRIQFQYLVNIPLKNPVCGIYIFRDDGLQCYGTNTQIDNISNLDLGEGGVASCDIVSNLLLPGEYELELVIQSEDGLVYDNFRCARTFQMYSETAEVGIVRMPHNWDVVSSEGGS